MWTPEDDELTPEDSGLSMAEALTSPAYADLWTAKLSPGDVAFDFELPLLDLTEGVERRTGETIRLSDFAGHKPVALIFGSYT